MDLGHQIAYSANSDTEDLWIMKKILCRETRKLVSQYLSAILHFRNSEGGKNVRGLENPSVLPIHSLKQSPDAYHKHEYQKVSALHCVQLLHDTSVVHLPPLK